MLRLDLLLVLPLLLASCGERDAKGLTDAATDAFQARDYKTSVSGFEHALTQMDAVHGQYMRAALGRCLALVHVDPAKGKDEFLRLATAEKARITTADVHLIVSEFVNAGEISLATDIVVGAQTLFPKSAELQKIGNSVLTAAQQVGDPRSSGRLEGHGYAGGSPRPPSRPMCELNVVLAKSNVANGIDCAGLRDGSTCLTLGPNPVHLEMRDICLAKDVLGWPAIAFSITDTERESCTALARLHPQADFVLVHDNRPYQRFVFGGVTPSAPSKMTLVPSEGHWTAEEANQQMLRIVGK